MSAIFNVPKGWEVIQLGKIGSFKNGVNKSKDDFGFGVPFINLQDVFGHWEIEHNDFDLVNVAEKELKNYNLKKGDILFIRSSVKPSGVGLTSVIKEDILNTIYSGFIIRFRSKDNILDIDYSKYCFHDEFFRQRLLQKSTVSANSNINQESLVTLDLLLPPIKEQEKIAEILSRLDKAIAATNCLIEKEKNIKISIMQELLTNGIDEKGQIRTTQTHKYRQSELGLIPDEWEFKKVSQISKTFAGGTPDRENLNYYNGDIPWVKSGEVNQSIITKTEETITQEGLNNSSTKFVQKGTILVAMYGATAGKVALLDIEATTNQAILAIPLKNDNTFFIINMLEQHMSKLVFQAQGSGQPNLSKQMVDGMVLPIAPIKEQNQIAKILTTQDKKIEIEEITLSKLKDLKKGLMNGLLSGKVRVKV